MDITELQDAKPYYKELSEISRRWQGSGLLDGLDGHRKQQVAAILENQRLYEERYNDVQKFVPMVAEIYRNFIGFDIVSIQTLLGPVGLVFYILHEYGEQEIKWTFDSKDTAAKTRKLTTQEGSAKLIKEEIEREIFTDLRNNCGTIVTGKLENGEPKNLLEAINKASNIIHTKILAGPATWIVTSKAMAKRLLPNSALEDGIHYCGRLDDQWNVFSDSSYPNNELIMGHYSKDFYSGYIFCPYIPITTVESHPSSFLMRYGKRLINSDFYARVKFFVLD